MTHALKTDPSYFELITSGVKTFDVRKFDRPFEANDNIILQCYNGSGYSGEEWHGVITHVMDDERYCKKGFCILSIKPKENAPKENTPIC